MRDPRLRPAVLAWVLAFLAVAGAVTASAAVASATPAPELPALDMAAAGRFAHLALGCAHQEYPNKIAHVLSADGDAKPPRSLHPAFYGCYDWHSSVHGHWLLARLARLFPEAPFAASARAALAESLTPERVAAEVAYLQAPGRTSFERPYGLAWVLQLALELREWGSLETEGPGDAFSVLSQVRAWSAALAPMEQAAREKLASWMPKLAYPIRIGEHDQTAFSFGLALDWARGAGDRSFIELVETTARRLYGADVACPLAYEPSGQDFLSPCIAEADLLRRVMPPAEFAAWLDSFLPQVPRDDGTAAAAAWLPVGVVTDRADPKLAHLDGLNLSRAWMLEGIASALPAGDTRRAALFAAAAAHRAAALPQVTGEHYEGGHWLGSFATYLTTRRGLAASE